MKLSELLTDESKWCRNAYARDSRYCAVFAKTASACRWCLSGAMIKCGIESHLLVTMVEGLGFGSIPDFNDDPKTTFTQIKEIIDAFERTTE